MKTIKTYLKNTSINERLLLVLIVGLAVCNISLVGQIIEGSF